jgi:hypothetical protein
MSVGCNPRSGDGNSKNGATKYITGSFEGMSMEEWSVRIVAWW